MDSERIDIAPFDRQNEHIRKCYYLYVQLFDEYLLYAGKYLGEIPVADDPQDHSMGWKNKAANFMVKIKREAFVSVEYFWERTYEVYHVELEANGYPNSLTLYFQTEKEAEAMYNKLTKYIFYETQNDQAL